MEILILHSLKAVKPADGEQQGACRQCEERYGDKRERAFKVLQQAQQYYFAMEQFRQQRARNIQYTYGDQWGDIINVDGKAMREDDYIKSEGNIPLKNNLIHRMVKTVVGVFRQQQSEPTCMARDRDEQAQAETMSTVLQCNWQLNRMDELNARLMEEFLMSAFVVCRKSFGVRNGRADCYTDYVQPNNFFIDNTMRDIRGWDCQCVGEVHDIPFEQVAQQFAESADDYAHLQQIYAACADKALLRTSLQDFGFAPNVSTDFFTPYDDSLCRVIEVWRKESKPRYRCHDMNSGEVYKIDIEDYALMVEAENLRRISLGALQGLTADEVPLIKAEWFIDEYWYYYFLTPTGEILREGASPYAHGSHPYVFKAYPFIDGQIHSFVADVIDQQRYINRLITMYDWIVRASAKGVLVFPEEGLPKGWSLRDIAEEWSRFNGIIPIRSKELQNGVMPQQISNNSTNVGIPELLNLQLKFFEDISGVNGAMQGKQGFSGMSASLYHQQAQNATTSLVDLMDAFSSFIKDAAYKDVKNIQQFYTQKRIFNIVGRSGVQVEYDPEKIRDIEFDLSIVESTATPAYRNLANEFLMQIWQSGQITLEQLLENGTFPFADQLLQSINAAKAEAEQQQAQQMQMQQAMQAQAAQAAPPGAPAQG